jgi:hypothetical protein
MMIGRWHGNDFLIDQDAAIVINQGSDRLGRTGLFFV